MRTSPFRTTTLNDTIVFLDNNTGGVVATRTDTVIEDLSFVFLDSRHNAVIDTDLLGANPANVMWVEARITIRTRTVDASTGQPMRRLLSRSEGEKPMTKTHIVDTRSEKGIALVMVLLLMAVLSGLATGFAMNGQVESAMAVNEAYYAGARAAAEAGINRAIAALRVEDDVNLLRGRRRLGRSVNPAAAENADNGDVGFLLTGASPMPVDANGLYRTPSRCSMMTIRRCTVAQR